MTPVRKLCVALGLNVTANESSKRGMPNLVTDHKHTWHTVYEMSFVIQQLTTQSIWEALRLCSTS